MNTALKVILGLSVVVALVGFLVWFLTKETFINDYYNSYCPRENNVYIHPPDWWRPNKPYNRDDWLVVTPDTCTQKEIWVQ